MKTHITTNQLKTLLTLVQAGLEVKHVETHPNTGVMTAMDRDNWDHHVVIEPDGVVTFNKFTKATKFLVL